MFNKLMEYATKPALYAPSTNKFWDDEHISKGMLEAHLHPSWDAASRNHEFLDRSAEWIASIASPLQYERLLDLGCGPGLYTERFNQKGYSVTGIDYSQRSINYAKKHKSPVNYRYQDYLTMNDHEAFHVITLIYCDYAVFPQDQRIQLLKKIYKALKPGGKFIFDVFTPKKRNPEKKSWHTAQGSGFWSENPHICLEAIYQYDNEDQAELNQYIVLTEQSVAYYHIWHHYFTKEKLLHELRKAGFPTFEWYDDVAGKSYTGNGEMICAVAIKD